MKIAVCVKQIAALSDEVEFDADEGDVDPDFLDHALNEWDAYAVEEGLRIREEHGGEVLVLSVGDEDAEEVLRRCAAMGADRIIRVAPASPSHDPLATARSLAAALEDERPDLVLCGAQSSDAVQGAAPSALAGFLGLPVVAVVRRIELSAGATTAVVHRELERGIVDVTEVDLPAVVSVQTGINEPRYVTLRAIQDAAARELPVIESAPARAGYRIRRMFVPERQHAVMLDGSPAEVARRILEIVEETVR